MASGRIKGITIEIGGDTSDLQKSLKGVDSQLKTTQGNLRDINKLLKLDPSNTELLTQKQKALEDAVSGTKERLTQLKDAQSGVTQGSAQWDALQREIIATEQDVKAAEDALKDFGSVAKQQLQVAADKVKEFGDKMGNIGTSMATHVTAPIVAVGAASMAAFSEVDAGMDIILAKTGASGEALEDMQKRAENLATSIPTDFETAGTAIGEVSTRFGLMGDALEDVSGKFIQFAQVNGVDVNSSIDAVQKTMAAFNVDASQTGLVLDTLNAVGQATGISLDALEATLVTNSAALHEMGFNLAESAQFLGQLEVSGVDSSAVLTGLKKALQNATKEGKPMAEAMQELQNNLVNASSSTEALQLATELFGAKAAPAMIKALQDGQISFSDFSASLEENAGNLETTFNGMLDPIDQTTILMNEVKLAGSDLGAAIQTAALPILERLIEVVKGVTERFRELTPEQQENIVKIGALVAAIAPALVIGGKVISTVGSVISILGTVIGVLGGPLTLAIGAVIALGVALWKNWDTIKEKAHNLAEGVRNAFQKIREYIKLPHFSLSGEFSLNPPSVPHISVDWYRKAMNNGVLFTSPTVLQTPQGMKGFGDAGAEVVLGLNKLRELVGSGSVVNNINVYGAAGQSEDALAQIIMDKLTAMEERTALGAL